MFNVGLVLEGGGMRGLLSTSTASTPSLSNR